MLYESASTQNKTRVQHGVQKVKKKINSNKASWDVEHRADTKLWIFLFCNSSVMGDAWANEKGAYGTDSFPLMIL